MNVVHCKRAKFDVLIDRTTKWGNPFVIGRDGNRAEVIHKYEEWIFEPEQEWLRKCARLELKGKILGCWCHPLACHGQILWRIANNDYRRTESRAPSIHPTPTTQKTFRF